MEFRVDKPIYMQISELVYENILSKRWKTDEKIPSVRELAVSIEVNPNTVMKTYSFLQDKGIIYNQRGVGFFVSEEGYNNTLTIKKENFFKNELPYFFKTIRLLNIPLKKIEELYEKEEI